jgi:hypothetical protein
MRINKYILLILGIKEKRPTRFITPGVMNRVFEANHLSLCIQSVGYHMQDSGLWNSNSQPTKNVPRRRKRWPSDRSQWQLYHLFFPMPQLYTARTLDLNWTDRQAAGQFKSKVLAVHLAILAAEMRNRTFSWSDDQNFDFSGALELAQGEKQDDIWFY